MTEPKKKKNEIERRGPVWPGGPRAIEQPATPLPDEPGRLDNVTDPDLAESETDWNDLWPNEKPAPVQPSIAGDPLPAEYTQYPSRTWPPEQFITEKPLPPLGYTPETEDESVRQRGLAFSIGIVFFSSVAFMLFLGWLADLLLGSSPWGIVGGIVLGSIIGFVQFFRISSRIFSSKTGGSEIRPLFSPRDNDDDEQPPQF